MTAADDLAQRLDDLEQAGRSWPCRGRTEWLDERHAVQREAATECAECPALAECAAVCIADPPSFGAWAGLVWSFVPAERRANVARLRGEPTPPTPRPRRAHDDRRPRPVP